jgi:2-dehydropantoate 2-reductase
MACTGAYYDVPMGAVQHEGEPRNTFKGLSAESEKIGKCLGITFPEDMATYNLRIIDKLEPETTASMQKDLANGHQSEIQGILFDMIELGEKFDIELPTYQKVAAKFRQI